MKKTTNDEITRVEIYPPLGIARVGNSPEAYFFGPEIPGVREEDKGNYRDEKGRIKRQAARFRLFG
ncbi:MAG: LodA/GoxA family CTQ-dependent oxidase, partial [Bacteroidia bacterium]|nr:LodA/GoxA family CTQ-dependent oxidase [Bacteroidia bacterium]